MEKFTVLPSDGQSNPNQGISSDRRVRIYEISKELNLNNQVVLAICEKLKISGVTSHSSTVSDEEARLIRQTVQSSVRVGLSTPAPTLSATVKVAEHRPLTLRCTPRTAQGFVEPLLSVGEALPLHMVLVPGGTFLMGQSEAETAELIRQVGEEDYKKYYGRELPQHEVTVPQFFISRYPVTQAQWRAVADLFQVKSELDLDPSQFKGDNRPVDLVTWYDAVEFCGRLSAHTGRQYRLPFEAEWEYACRAGTITPFYFGKTLTTKVANYDGRDTYADGPKGEYSEETTPVDHFGIANAFGLCDMHGNVFEWCQDHFHYDYKGSPTDGSAWVEGGDSERRILRGGSWNYSPRLCRSAFRGSYGPGDVNLSFGFRVVCSASGDLQLPTG